MDLNRSFKTGKWRSASTQRLLGLLPEHGKPDCISAIAKDIIISNELSEDDFFWLDDLILTKRRANNGRSVPHCSKAPALIHRNMSFVRRSESFGVLGVLPERRARPVFDHKLTNARSATASSWMITKPIQNEKYSDSLGRYRHSSSMPVNVPINLPMTTKKRHQWEFDDINDDGDEADDGRAMVPPHEMVARTLARSEMVAFSVLEGAGRTLKGRDLRQVRNAVFRNTGFMD